MRRLAALLPAALALTLVPVAGATTIARVTLPQMVGNADVVFVGVFESAAPSSLGGLRGIRYRFRAERFLRGGRSKTVHLSVPEIPGVRLGLEPGQRYLVFAERGRFGRAREERLTASGYHQGVYDVLSETRAGNAANGVVDLRLLPARLRREVRVRVTLLHEVDISKRAYIEGATYVVRLERGGRVLAKESGFLEAPRRFRVPRGRYTIRSGSHPCGGSPCSDVDFQNDLGVDRCSRRVELRRPAATIRITARAGEPCRIALR